MAKVFVPRLSILTLLHRLPSAADALSSRKYDTWYSTYGPQSSITVCNHTLRDYLDYHPRTSTDILKVIAARHADCILENTTETNMASAGVVLGLMPHFLSYLGPTLSESSILMLERPLLSVLLVIGGPAIYPARSIETYDPFEALKPLPWRHPSVRPAWWVQGSVSLLEYLVAVAAAANVVIICLDLGFKIIVTWKKLDSYLPLIWVILPLFVHFCAETRLYTATVRHPILICRAYAYGPNMGSFCSPAHWFIAETQLCSARPGRDYPTGREEPFHLCIFSVLISLFCVVHQALVVIIFSSLLFIAVNDAIPILIRFASSAFAVQGIGAFEIKGLLAERRRPS